MPEHRLELLEQIRARRSPTRQEMQAAEEAEMVAYMDEVEQEEDEPEPSYPSIQPAPDIVVVDISDDEDYLGQYVVCST